MGVYLGLLMRSVYPGKTLIWELLDNLYFTIQTQNISLIV